MTASDAVDCNGVYDAMASSYDSSYEAPTHRRAYDLLAWEAILETLPAAPATIIDAGCGTGRSCDRLLPLGYRVVGLERSPGMLAVLRARAAHPMFSVIEGDMTTAPITLGSADAVLALGSVQYVHDPSAMMARFATWLRPGGVLCLYVDSLVSVMIDMLRQGRREDAILALETRRGHLSRETRSVELRLYDNQTLRADLTSAGFVDITCRPLLVSGTTLGRPETTTAMQVDGQGLLSLERRLAKSPSLADLGLHIFARATRPN